MFTPTEKQHYDSNAVAGNMRETRAALILRGGRIAGVVAILVNCLFAFTDWLVYYDAVAVAIRLLTAFGIILPLWLTRTQWGAQHSLGLVSTGFFITGAGLSGLLWHLNIFPKAYEGGFILIIFTFCVIIPATIVQSALVCTALLAICFGPALLKNGFSITVELVVLAISLGGTSAIGLLSRYIANTLWEREFRAHQELQQALNELQVTQHQLVQSEKMAALGRLVASIAHDLNNPLAVIDANLHSLKRTTGALDKEAVELITRGVERATAVVQNLRRYSIAFLGQHSLADLNAVAETSVLMVETKVRQRALTLHREYGDLPPVKCDAKSLSQVFVIVLENACEAVAPAGNIWVRTEMIPDGNGSARSTEKWGAVLITIRDDGPGIPPEQLPKIFDPSFTTKPPGSGTGLGLALARHIVEDHGGEIEIANGSPGAIVSITLPTTFAAASAQAEVTQ